MGHDDHKTTEGYIGTLDASACRAPELYSFDPAHLDYTDLITSELNSNAEEPPLNF